MPWKECQKMDEKLRFVSRHLEGESISQLCREFGISRVRGISLLSVTVKMAWKHSVTEAGARTGWPTSCHFKWRP